MTLGPHAQTFWDTIPPNDRKEIEARAARRIAEYRNLQEVRKAAGLTQSKISRELDVPQSNISRMEKSSDMLLSTLRGYIEAMGGKLNLTVELPNQPPVILTGLGDLIEESGPRQDS